MGCILLDSRFLQTCFGASSARELADAINQIRRLGQFFDFAHDCAADHRGICKTPDFAHLFWGRDAEPDRNGQIADGAP